VLALDGKHHARLWLYQNQRAFSSDVSNLSKHHEVREVRQTGAKVEALREPRSNQATGSEPMIYRDHFGHLTDAEGWRISDPECSFCEMEIEKLCKMFFGWWTEPKQPEVSSR
jgi:hypothetical protein